MTALTAEQMRALADQSPGFDEIDEWYGDVKAALRAAADQLEEDQRVIDGIKACWKVDMLALQAMKAKAD